MYAPTIATGPKPDSWQKHDRRRPESCATGSRRSSGAQRDFSAGSAASASCRCANPAAGRLRECGPRVFLPPDETDLGGIVVLIRKKASQEVTSPVSTHGEKNPGTPPSATKARLRFLAAAYYQRPDEFSDELTALFGPAFRAWRNSFSRRDSARSTSSNSSNAIV